MKRIEVFYPNSAGEVECVTLDVSARSEALVKIVARQVLEHLTDPDRTGSAQYGRLVNAPAEEAK